MRNCASGNLEIPGSREDARPGMTAQQKGPLSRAFSLKLSVSAAAMPMAVPARIAAERLQLQIGDPGGNVQPGLALHAERLQCVGIGRTTDQEIAAAAD